MTTAPRRRWFRFSLRTFFVIVAVLGIGCAFLAREAAVVRERNAVLDWLAERQYRWPDAEMSTRWLSSTEPSTAPIWRYWLGEELSLKSANYFIPGATQSDIDRVKAAFPEATVERVPDLEDITNR